ANDYFSIDRHTAAEFDLDRWTRPLLPRIRHARGLEYVAADHAATLLSGAKGYLLEFAQSRPDPESCLGAYRYLRIGEEMGLPRRYKCRIREPWYRVPIVPPKPVLLSKRAHVGHRVVLNSADVLTTDTIYGGQLQPTAVVSARDVAALFHNSLTLLSAE